MTKPQVTWVGITLIFIVGLLNFHIPHFFLESNHLSGAGRLIELVYVLNLLGALVAAVGIYKAKRWAWSLGIGVSVLSALLWIAQETVGLPDLPQQWFEPSRIVSLIVEAVFVYIAWKQLHQTNEGVL